MLFQQLQSRANSNSLEEQEQGEVGEEEVVEGEVLVVEQEGKQQEKVEEEEGGGVEGGGGAARGPDAGRYAWHMLTCADVC